ncbi:MAG: toll/interleukin-1 receptor domain-containing protein [Bryobacterales bacterium]|nr:toll/interleukin-1 receptor domain-containing protein [Bryobacterales bacterium]
MSFYKREDQPAARAIVEALRMENLDVFWDQDIEVSENWHARLESELEAAECVVVLWTRLSVRSQGGFVQDEARRAARRGALFSVLIDDVALPLGFGQLQALNLMNWNGQPADPRFRSLVRALTNRLVRARDLLPAAPTQRVPRPQPRKHLRRVGLIAVPLLVLIAAIGLWQFREPEIRHWEATAGPYRIY